MNFKRLGFTEIPLTVTMALGKDAEVLQFDDGAIELHFQGTHLLSWTKATGWTSALPVGAPSPNSRRNR